MRQKNSRPDRAADGSFQPPGIQALIPQIGGGKVFIFVVPGQVLVKGRIDAQRERLSGQALPELGKDKLSGGPVRMRIFLFHTITPGTGCPDRPGIIA